MTKTLPEGGMGGVMSEAKVFDRSGSGRRRGPWLLSMVALALSLFLCAGRVPGPEILVNTNTANHQYSPALTVTPGGYFVVAWSDSSPNGSGYYQTHGSVRARRFSASGSPEGAEFVVAVPGCGWGYYGMQGVGGPDVASDAAGNFVVAWSGSCVDACAAGSYAIYSRVRASRYSANGAWASDMSLAASGNDWGAITVPTASGEFLLGGSGRGVTCCYYVCGPWGYCSDCFGGDPAAYFNLFDNAGNWINGGRPNTNTSPQGLGAIAADAAGNFILAWWDGGDDNPWGQLFDPGGTAIGGNFRLGTNGTKSVPRVTMGFLGGFVGTWVDPAGRVVARRFQPSGSPVDAEFTVSDAARTASSPDVAMGPGGQFAIVWGEERADRDVLGRCYARNGGPIGGTFPLSVTTADDQFDPQVAYDGSGGLVAAWSSNGQDGDGSGVYARQFAYDPSTGGKLHVGIGPGPNSANPPLSAEVVLDGPTGSLAAPVYSDGGGTPVAHYGTAAAGVNVGGGDITPAYAGEFMTGPGSVSVYGPHVRAWAPGGAPIAKVSFYAYGTLRFGAKVRGGRIDGDAFDELLTGAGAGVVFGPHVRAFDFDGGTLQAISKVSYFAYNTSTYRYGVNIEAGDVEGDGVDELLTGPASPTSDTWLKVWRTDPLAGVAMLAEQQPVYFNPNDHGLEVAAGDLDGDGRAEVLCGRGPGPLHDGLIRAYAVDATPALVALPEIARVAFPAPYGIHLASVDLDGDGLAEVYTAPGPDPVLPARLRAFVWPGPGADLDPMGGCWDLEPFGLAAPAAAYGATLGRGEL